MNFLLYAGKVVLCSAILFGYYSLFLRNKSFHRYNRFYLLAAAAFSVLFPLFRIPVFQEAGAASVGWLQSLRFISMNSWEEAFVVTVRTGNALPLFSWHTIAWIVYAGGAVGSSIPVLRSWVRIKKISRKYKKEDLDGVAFYNTREPGTPFSFFRSLFWNDQIPPHSEQGRSILQHELFHINERHSHDILFMQLLTNLFWFNPFFHIFLKELQTIHEFLADKWAGSTVNKWDYAELLVTQAIGRKRIAVSHQFYHYQIKRRIAMIIKQPTNSGYLSRILALPLLFVLFFQVSCTRTNDPSHSKLARGANTQALSTNAIIPAREFMNKVEKHLSGKEMSVAFRADTLLNLLTAKFENGEMIMTRLSEWNEWKKLAPKQAGDASGISEPVFTKVEIEADYPGGSQAYLRFLTKAFRYPEEAQAKEIQGTVIVQFKVAADGNISDVRAISGPDSGGLKEEAVRVIRSSGKWLPAMQNGHAVASIKKQPIIFRLARE